MTKATGVGRGNNPASWDNTKRGSEHHRWTLDHKLNEDGYVKLRVGKEHPLADPNGFAYEHVVVWCAAGRPRPGDGEILHHRNEDKTDNRIGNLELLTRGAHNALHNAERGRDDDGRFKAAGRTLDGRTWDQYPSV
jgi:hypothetical protein